MFTKYKIFRSVKNTKGTKTKKNWYRDGTGTQPVYCCL